MCYDTRRCGDTAAALQHKRLVVEVAFLPYVRSVPRSYCGVGRIDRADVVSDFMPLAGELLQIANAYSLYFGKWMFKGPRWRTLSHA